MFLAIPTYYVHLSFPTGICYLLLVWLSVYMCACVLSGGVIQDLSFLNGASPNTVNLYIKSEFADSD